LRGILLQAFLLKVFLSDRKKHRKINGPFMLFCEDKVSRDCIPLALLGSHPVEEAEG
jgi:hypothetical protein